MLKSSCVILIILFFIYIQLASIPPLFKTIVSNVKILLISEKESNKMLPKMFAGKDFQITHTDTNLLAFNNRKKAWWFVLLWPKTHF